MSTSRAALAAAVMFAALPLAAAAQSTPPPAPNATVAHPHHGAWMSALHSLALSDAQRAQIKDLVKQTHAANQNADPETKRANMRKLHDQISGVLTPDQRTQFAAALKARRHAPAPSPAP